MSISGDGAKVYNAEGELVGTVHLSTRSGRWFHKSDGVVGPARHLDAAEAAVALRKAHGGRR